MDGFKAIVIVERANSDKMRLRDTLHQCDAIGYAFEAYGPALVFMRTIKAKTVLVEFDVGAETIDFYDAAKALEIPVVFSANSLLPHSLSQYGLSASAIVRPRNPIERRAS